MNGGTNGQTDEHDSGTV